MKHIVISVIAFLSIVLQAYSQDTIASKFGIYVDAMYSTRFDNSLSDIPYSTQTAFNNDVNINLAYISSITSYKGIELHLTLQEGKYTRVNYYDSDYDYRMIQELNLQYGIGPIRLTAGVMPAHTGYGYTTAMNNINVTQSLIFDATMYYNTGALIEYSDSVFKAGVTVVQGWQRITDNNESKSVGTLFQWTPSNEFTVRWNTMSGNDAAPGDPIRMYNDLWAEFKRDNITIAAIGNFAMMSGKIPMRYIGAQAQYRVGRSAIGARYENVNDPNQVVFSTKSNYEFICNNYSINFDYTITKAIGARAEVRTTHSPYPIFNNNTSITYLTISSYFHI